MTIKDRDINQMKSLLKETRSLCPNCMKEVKAQIFESDGKAILKKKCEEHGVFEIVVEIDAALYKMVRSTRPKGKRCCQ
jgi:uncharacterized radical SAM superfamily Fe-S cluster-containing enzyme